MSSNPLGPFEEKMPNPQSAPVKRLDSLQCLRALAATAVVVHHAYWFFTTGVPESSSFAKPAIFGLIHSVALEVGSAGVDVFFVLSGFIMVYIAAPYARGEKSVADFVARRVIRVYPLYFLMTVYYAGHQYGVLSNPGVLFRSLLFIPAASIPGGYEPVLGVAWTLYFEVLFYTYFSFALFIGRTKVVPHLICLVVAGIAFGKIATAAFGGSPVFDTLASTITLEFVGGCGLASLWLSQHRVYKVNGHLPIFAGLALLLIHEHGLGLIEYRFLGRGIPAAMIVYGFLCLDLREFRWPRWIIAIGDASYAIYLAHMPLIAIWIVNPLAMRSIRSGNGYTTDVLVAFSSIAAIAAGTLIHFLIERPIHRDLSKAYSRRFGGGT